MKPSALLLRGGTVSPSNLAVISCSITSRTCGFLKLRNPRALSPSLHAISSSTHWGFSIVSSPTYPKQNVQRYLTSPQLVFPIWCRGLAAVSDNYLGKALAIRLGRHATDSRRPTIPVRRPDVQEEDPPLSSVEHSSPPSTCDTTVVHHPEATEQSALQPPVFINLLSAPITTAFDHLPQDAQPPVIIDRTADDSHVPRSSDLPTSRQSDYFLASAPAFPSERSSFTADF
jgi:hypothetical protein